MMAFNEAFAQRSIFAAEVFITSEASCTVVFLCLLNKCRAAG
jgi:hypothetical protein